jgi:hypothetical protein
VLKHRLGDKSASSLNQMARKVSFVWNDCNATQKHIFATKWRGKTNGGLLKPWKISRPDRRKNWTCRLPSSICPQYVKSRKQHKKRWLRYRGRKSLGQVPLHNDQIFFDGKAFVFNAIHYKPMLLREGYSVRPTAYPAASTRMLRDTGTST